MLCITFKPVRKIRYGLPMTNRVRLYSIVGLAIMLSLLAVAPAPSFAGCKNSGGSSGHSKFGSQVDGGSVTICASAVAVTPARSAVVKTPLRSITKTISKPTPVVKVVPAFHRISTPISPAKKTAKPITKPAVKIVPKKKFATKVISKPSSANKTSAVASFTPAGVNGNVYPSSELVVGQHASFTSSAVQHYRAGKLLGVPTEVRFTPTSVLWDFGDGNSGSGSYVPHSFSSTGTHQVQVRVVYAVSYRLRGSLAWIAEPDSITVADDLVVDVSAGASYPDDAPVNSGANTKVLLVGQDCLARPGSFGCN